MLPGTGVPRSWYPPHSGPVPTPLLILIQVVTAVALGAAAGLERELSNQPAGLRTHMLVALGAVVFTIGGARANGRVLRIQYNGTTHQILLVARPRYQSRLTEISEKLRALDGVVGVDMVR